MKLTVMRERYTNRARHLQVYVTLAASRLIAELFIE